MLYKTVISLGLCSLVFAPPLSAGELPKGALCALADIQECDAGASCEKVAASDIAVPRFIRVELTARTLRGVGPRARDRVTKITSVDQRGDLIFAQGIDEEIQGERSALAWILALAPTNGSLRLTVTGEDASFLATGECLIDE